MLFLELFNNIGKKCFFFFPGTWTMRKDGIREGT